MGIIFQIVEEIVKQTNGPFRARGDAIEYKMVLPNGIIVWHECAALDDDEILFILTDDIKKIKLADPDSLVILQEYLARLANHKYFSPGS